MLSESFLDYIKKESLFERNEHLLLAISGGVDSVVLAHLLRHIGFHFSLAHMNFQLRGEESDKDQEYVESLASELGVPIHVKKVEIQKEKGSTQLQARNLRYKWFEELMLCHSYDKLLTAHHANDQFETVLFNLSRGSGIKGFRGMLPLQNKIARPLLFASKKEIIEYAENEEIDWREDASNETDHYNRNKIRHHIIPQFENLNPNVIKGFQQTSLKMRAAEQAYNNKLDQLKTKFFILTDGEVKIKRSILDIDFPIVYLSDLLSDFDFSLNQLQSFDFDRVGAQLYSNSHMLIVDRKFIFVNIRGEKTKQEFPQELKIESKLIHTSIGKFKINILDKEEVDFAKNQKLVFIDLESINGTLELDYWQEGDKIQPLGMKGKKKISDILIDQKVPLHQKENKLVLKSEGEVVWLVGHKFSDLFKVKDSTKKVLRIEHYENS
ncbi:tRNA lysidine(34) synthetase TilS [Marivirga arenosa]|uniref:tRNA(Ile)-lysidine synthase n=1 Tax=Marivirga arenosa TaxID=3059076 RepID=A0AA51N5L3_9BACT|nr:tRNA lysidine(34) synthetase TilS [Marivirga sp. ABR2-2]WMN06463.1 tRNA lysidine(34) synthetase TilS [Marivirga sp. ABR2-2]